MQNMQPLYVENNRPYSPLDPDGNYNAYQRPYRNGSFANRSWMPGYCQNLPWIACCLAIFLLIALILLCVATGVPNWLEGDITQRVGTTGTTAVTFQRTYGLFNICGRVTDVLTLDDSCVEARRILNEECMDAKGAFSAVQALSIISILLAALALLALLVLLCMPHFWLLRWVAAALVLFSFILAIAVLIVFGVGPGDTDYNCTGSRVLGTARGVLCPNCSLVGGFWVMLAAVILLFIILLGIYCDLCLSHRRSANRQNQYQNGNVYTASPTAGAYVPPPSPPPIARMSPNVHHGYSPMYAGRPSPPMYPIASGMPIMVPPYASSPPPIVVYSAPMAPSPPHGMPMMGMPMMEEPLLMRVEEVKARLQMTINDAHYSPRYGGPKFAPLPGPGFY